MKGQENVWACKDTNRWWHAERWCRQHLCEVWEWMGSPKELKEKWPETWAQGPSGIQRDINVGVLFINTSKFLLSTSSPRHCCRWLGQQWLKKVNPPPSIIFCSWASYLTWLNPTVLICKMGLTLRFVQNITTVIKNISWLDTCLYKVVLFS